MVGHFYCMTLEAARNMSIELVYSHVHHKQNTVKINLWSNAKKPHLVIEV